MRGSPHLESEVGARVALELRRVAKAANRNTDAVATRFVLERVVARIFAAAGNERFALKGGMVMMQAEGAGPVLGRATTDVDLHIPFEGPIEDMERALRECLSHEPDTDDGVRLDVGSMRLVRTRDGAVAGAAMTVTAQVGQIGVRVRCDLGFDARPVMDAAVDDTMPSVLPGMFPPVPVRRIPFSWVLADKVQALVRHGEATTRLRDVYDLAVILRRGMADPAESAHAMRMTFELFGGEVPPDPGAIRALSPEWAERNAPAWERDVRRKGHAVPMPDLAETCAAIREGLGPMFEMVHDEAPRPF